MAGHTGPALFTDQAYDKIANFSDGIPRNVNNVCFNALSLACASRKSWVDENIVDEVLDDLDIEKWTSAGDSSRENSMPLDSNGSESVPRMIEPPEISTPAEAAAYMKQFIAGMKARR